MIRIFEYSVALALTICGLVPKGVGQQQPVTDLYIFEGLTINPAFAGASVQLSATLIHREQWVNFPGAPKTSVFATHSTFMKNKIGVGLLITNDRIGIHSDIGVYGTYAYRIEMERVTLSMGLQGGFNNISSNFSLLNIKDQTDNLLAGSISTLNPNFGAGIYLYNNISFVGFSVPYILNSQIVDVESVLSEARRFRYYYLYGGTTYDLNPNVKFRPSGLLRIQEGAPFSMDITARFILYEAVSVGTSYRWADAIMLIVEVKLHENLHFGYAYDHTLSDIGRFSNGSHEIMLNYRYKIPIVHQGLACPAYF